MPEQKLQTRCPGCAKTLSYPPARAGSRLDHACGVSFLLERPRRPTTEESAEEELGTSSEESDAHRTHCPGCFRRLKYPAFAEGTAYTHSCGEIFPLRADDALEASEPDGPGSEYLEELEILRFAAVAPAVAPAAEPPAAPEPEPFAIAATPALPPEPPRPEPARRARRPGPRPEWIEAAERREGKRFLIGVGLMILVVCVMFIRSIGQEEDPLPPPVAEGPRSEQPERLQDPRPLPPLPPLPGTPSETAVRDPEPEPPLEVVVPPVIDDGLPPPIVIEAGGNDEEPPPPAPEPEVEEGPAEPEPAPTEAEPVEPWDVRFARLAGEYEGARSSGREGLIPEMLECMQISLGIAKKDLRDAAEILAFYDEHGRPFRSDASLRAVRHEHRRAWFRHAFLDASGPGMWQELAEQCKEWDLDSERAEVIAMLNSLEPTTEHASVQASRHNERVKRYELRKELEAFVDEQKSGALDALTEVVGWMDERNFAPRSARARIDEVMAGLELDEEQSAPVLAALGEVMHMVSEDELPKLNKVFESRLESAVAKTVNRLGKAVENCLRAGLAGQAFDLLQTLLKLDPNNADAHEGLGHVLIDGVWYRKYEAERLQGGEVWSDEFAWMPVGEEERYRAGEIFDPQTGEWTSLSAANEAHSEPDNAWRIESENFLLISTADLHLTATVLKRLEAVFLQVFRQYDLFFKGDQGAQLIFGMGKIPEKMVVNLYRSQEQFRDHANPPTDWAAGFYSGRRGGSFFYCNGDRVSFTTLQHELIHQILGELSRGGGAPSWLAEGAAVYLESAFFAGEYLSLGSISDYQRIMGYIRRLRQGEDEHSFVDMLGFRTGREWDSGDISQNYRGAGAIVYFMMHFDDGRYRGDYLELLHDRYNRSRRPPEYYFGMTHETLDRLMERFFKNVRIEPSERS